MVLPLELGHVGPQMGMHGLMLPESFLAHSPMQHIHSAPPMQDFLYAGVLLALTGGAIFAAIKGSRHLGDMAKEDPWRR